MSACTELNPQKPWSAEARLKQYGIPVWAIVGYLPVYEDLDEIARGYDVPRAMVEAAAAYYRRHKGAIDARIEANNAPLATPSRSLTVAELYSDRDIGFGTVVASRSLGHTVVTTRDLRFEYVTDDVQLLTAVSCSRIPVTQNRRDYVLLHRAWRSRADSFHIPLLHSGILVVPQQTWPFPLEAAIIDWFIRTVPPLANEMYVCDRDGRWSSASMQ
jgi:uncharacterized protein (DUF433 family)